MKTKKENAPILEEVLAKFRKERVFQKIRMEIHILVFFVWRWCISGFPLLMQGKLNIWTEISFQIYLII